MSRLMDMAGGRARSLFAGLLLLGLAAGWPGKILAASEVAEPAVVHAGVITNLAQFWHVGGDPELRGQYHQARLEMLIYYCETNWDVYFGQSDGLNTFLPLRNLPVHLKSGQKVVVEGLVLPASQEFLWAKTTVRVLSESNQIETVSARGQLLNTNELQTKFVEIEALVESVQVLSPCQLSLGLIAENTSFNAHVYCDEPLEVWPDLVNQLVRIRGVYVATLDALGKIGNLALWTPGLNQITVTGSLAEDARFSRPVTLSKDWPARDTNTLIHVAGMVRSQLPGESVTLWDARGQVRLLTPQHQPLRAGDPIEAVGYPALQGNDRVLQRATFRSATQLATSKTSFFTTGEKLRLADQIRGLNQEQLAQKPPVSLEGEVTWVDAQHPLMFIQDSSGGMRVQQNRLQSGRLIKPGMLVSVAGFAGLGEFAPVIANASVNQIGVEGLLVAPIISFEQALTGTEDGHWVQLRGYVRRATEVGGTLEIQLVAPGGEFTAHVPVEDAAQARPGSVVLVRGVCVALANARRQLTGVQIWSSVAGSVQTEQLAPEDLFALPQCSLASLRQFNPLNTLNKLVHTRGVVTLHVPGRYLYLQDVDDSLFALSNQAEPLQPGDRVEVVGFPGDATGKFLLREAVYRRIATGPEPAPLPLTKLESADENLDGLLVRTEGLLLEAVQKADETRLIIQVKGHVFEAELKPATGREKLLPGSRLALTGVYRIQRDEYGKPLAFLLNLRTAEDIRIVTPPAWWTSGRLLLLLAVGLPLFLLALVWAWQTRRKNRQLQRAQVELINAHEHLEELVAARTQNLQVANEALQDSEERFAKAFRSNPVPLVLVDAADWRLVDVNGSFLQLTGFSREALLGKTPDALKLFRQSEVAHEIHRTLSAARPVRNRQTDFQAHDGRPFTALLSAEPLELHNRTHALLSLQDITERINVENQLRQAQKMEAVGQIAAGVAHDFNNLLAVILGHAEMHLRDQSWDESLPESMQEICQAANRAAALTGQLLAFSRKQMLRPSALDLAELLNNLGRMLHRIIGEEIHLQIHCAENLPPVMADQTNLEQVVLNLAVNARDAMPKGGPLTITTELVVVDAQHQLQQPESRPGTFVKLSVADQGAGMDKAVQRKIFEPFFTTKAVGKGTGMGLATVYGIVKQHQGWIEVESQLGKGSVFKVFLPLSQGDAKKPTEPEAELIRDADFKPRTIFIVEDETSVRELTAKVLKRLGHEVITAKSGPDALQLWPQYQAKIDLLFTDMRMPGGMSGRELAEKLWQDKPSLRVLYSTGYTVDLSNPEINLIEGVNLLMKPYDIAALQRAVKQAFQNAE